MVRSQFYEGNTLARQKRVLVTNLSLLVSLAQRFWSKRRQVFESFLTGSLPSMASSHSLLLDSDNACSVITPCLKRFQRKAALSLIDLIALGAPELTMFVYTGSDLYKRTCATKIAHVQTLDFKLCP